MRRDMEYLRLCGVFNVGCCDANGRTVWRELIRNAPTTQGLNAILEDFFAGGTQKPQWFCGLINNEGYTGVDAADVMDAHEGWTEYTGYSQAARPQYSDLGIASGIIRNKAAMQFSFQETATIRGIFLVSNATKGGTTGTLWNRGVFSAPRSMVAGQTMQVTYLLRAGGGAS